MIVIASLFAAATVAAATVTTAIVASVSAQNQNATQSVRAAVCGSAPCAFMRVQLDYHVGVPVRLKGFAYLVPGLAVLCVPVCLNSIYPIMS